MTITQWEFPVIGMIKELICKKIGGLLNERPNNSW